MKILKTLPTKENFVVITLVDYKGSVPQSLGAKAVVTEAGLYQGTVGGGKVEAKAIALSLDILKDAKAPVCQLITWNLTRDVGMTCGGVATFLFETHKPAKWNIVVFGAGHVAQELVCMLTRLDCRVTCVDSRAEWLDKLAPAENLLKILTAEPKDAVQNLDEDSYFILMTQGHATDLPILTEILRRYNPPYVGAIGSKTKAAILRANLKELDFSKTKIEGVYCPIGLDFGNNTPVEISHSVIAQILQLRGKQQEAQNEHD